MGGKNCIMIMDDADLDLALEGACGAGSARQGSGAPRRAASSSTRKSTNGSSSSSWNASRRCASATARSEDAGGPVDQREAVEKVDGLHRDRAAGRRDAGLWRPRLERGRVRTRLFHEPTVFIDVTPQMRIAHEEIFGPVVSVLKCGSLEEAIEIANGVTYGLSASIYTQDVNRAFRAMREMYTGIFYVNASTIGAEVHLPFGGTKARATAIAKPALRRSTSSRNGSRFTWTSAANCNGRRSTTTLEPMQRTAECEP